MEGWFEELKKHSDKFETLWRKYSIVPQISFGIADAEGGYGWHPMLFVELVRLGQKCHRPGCLYDTAGTKEEILAAMQQENERPQHRHAWERSERSVFLWGNHWDQEPLGEALENFLKEAKEIYGNF